MKVMKIILFSPTLKTTNGQTAINCKYEIDGNCLLIIRSESEKTDAVNTAFVQNLGISDAYFVEHKPEEIKTLLLKISLEPTRRLGSYSHTNPNTFSHDQHEINLSNGTGS